jgi:heterokaryon incompatibility protein (HET)
MDKVYRNAYCTIAASIGCSPYSGLFVSRAGQHPQAKITIKQTWKAENYEAEFILVPSRISYARGYDPLYKRAWIVQERFLSPRMVYFSRTVYFECAQGVMSESSGDSRSLLTSSKPIKSWDISGWISLLSIYTSCDLTRQSDKLVAISGVAKSFSEPLSVPYYAGIWGGEYFFWGLLWQKNCAHGCVDHSLQRQYRGMCITL